MDNKYRDCIKCGSSMQPLIHKSYDSYKRGERNEYCTKCRSQYYNGKWYTKNEWLNYNNTVTV